MKNKEIELCTLFNSRMKELIYKTSTILKTEHYIQLFDNLVAANNKVPLEQFTYHILPERDRIKNKDENYFLNEFRIEDENITPDIETQIDFIKNIFKETNSDIKKCTWQYLKLLVSISEDYVVYKST
jgi:hypothetical protein